MHTPETLLQAAFLTDYNLSLLHKCLHAGDEAETLLRSALGAGSNYHWQKRRGLAQAQSEAALEQCQKDGVRVLAYTDSGYPEALRRLRDFPPLLFVKGSLPAGPCAAVVGTREPSPLAPTKTGHLVALLAGRHYGIVSGLALGIDTIAHHSALHHGAYTLAVLPTALDRLYPPQNRALADRLLDSGGALLTEQAPGLQAVGNGFVLRNRLQAALSDVVIPVEMGKESGTGYTVQYAVRYKKKVVLLLPGTFEIDHYLPKYEGLIIAAKKWGKKEGVYTLKDRLQLPAILDGLVMQPRLFE